MGTFGARRRECRLRFFCGTALGFCATPGIAGMGAQSAAGPALPLRLPTGEPHPGVLSNLVAVKAPLLHRT